MHVRRCAEVMDGLVAGWLASMDAHATEPMEATEATEPGRRFVLGATLGLNVGVFPIPSGELSLFLGGTPAWELRRPNHWLAIGYKGAIAAGYADILTVDDDWPYSRARVYAHRHHVAIQGAAGRRGRLFYGASAGLIASSLGPAGGDEYGPRSGLAVGVEGEGRIGFLFAGGSGVFGGQLRVSKVFVTGGPPLPTLGLFVGFVLGPRRAATQTRAVSPAPPVRDADGDGVGGA